MRAVILAAGQGTRLRPKTDDRPKCLVELAGRPLLEWQLNALRSAGIVDVTVVTGYRAERVACDGIRAIRNDRYTDTNMVASLMCARECFTGDDDVLIAYGDIVYEPRLVEALVDLPVPVAVAVDVEWRRLWQLRMADPLADAETLRIEPDGRLREIGRKPSAYDDIEAQYIGLIAVRADFARELIGIHDALDPAGLYEGRTRDQMFMTAFLQHLIDTGTVVGAVRVAGGWVEIDTLDDLTAYESLYRAGELARYVELPGG